MSVFVSQCAGCNEPGPTLCRSCRFSLASARTQVSPDGVLAALPFDGVARQVLLALKYRNRRGVARSLAQLIVRRLRVDPVDVVTWAPTSGSRARTRGYDQSELLAKAVARELGVPCRRLLYRSHGEQQTGHTRAERLHGVSFRSRAISRSGRSGRQPLRIMLVDDVVTTGATLVAARDALQRAGAASVVCVAAAATPANRSSIGATTSAPEGFAKAS
ncbi:MAG: phosphoribosyltransferase family protein [Ilumatobacteraceae bacterium]